jgi:hypothetical protein
MKIAAKNAKDREEKTCILVFLGALEPWWQKFSSSQGEGGAASPHEELLWKTIGERKD